MQVVSIGIFNLTIKVLIFLPNVGPHVHVYINATYLLLILLNIFFFICYYFAIHSPPVILILSMCAPTIVHQLTHVKLVPSCVCVKPCIVLLYLLL